jgi:hypothetical protein
LNKELHMSDTNAASLNTTNSRPVDISFDCMPLRSMARLDPPIDASPALAAKYDRIQAAIAEHGTYNTYFLHNATCRFFVTNDPGRGMIAFKFEGVVFTNDSDSQSKHACLTVTLDKETCSWLEQHVVKWFEECVTQAVVVEFDRYIGAGDAEQTRKRKEQMEQMLESQGGFVGMHL